MTSAATTPSETALRALAAEIEETRERLVTLHLNPVTEVHEIMAALDQLKTYRPRLDAIAAAVGTDVATAVANATAAKDQQIADLTNAAASTEAETQTVADDIGAGIAAAETAVGIAPPAPEGGA